MSTDARHELEAAVAQSCDLVALVATLISEGQWDYQAHAPRAGAVRTHANETHPDLTPADWWDVAASDDDPRTQARLRLAAALAER